MTDSREDGDSSLYLRLLLGLLPFDVDVTVDAINDLLSEAEKTSWPAVMRRSANLGMVLFTIGFLGVIIMLYPLANFSDTPIENVGPIYRVAIAAVILMVVAKSLLGWMQNIDTGDSPFVPRDRSTRITSFFEFLLGVGFVGLVSIPLSQILSWDLLFMILLAVSATGISITGISLTISGASDVLQTRGGDPSTSDLNPDEGERSQ